MKNSKRGTDIQMMRTDLHKTKKTLSQRRSMRMALTLGLAFNVSYMGIPSVNASGGTIIALNNPKIALVKTYVADASMKKSVTLTMNRSLATYGDDAKISVTLEPTDVTGTVIVTINGRSYTSSVINGTADIIISNLAVGSYTISASYSGDNNYDSAYKSDGEITISKRLLTITPQTVYRWTNQQNPILTGLISADETNITANYKTTANKNSPAGSYPIEVDDSDGKLSNYSILLKEGNVIVYNPPQPTLAQGDTLTSIAQNVVFPLVDAQEIPVTWTSSDEQLLDSSTGQIQRPAYEDGNKQVTVTASIHANGETYSKSYDVTILAGMPDSVAVVQDKQALAIQYQAGDSSSSVTGNVTLPTSGQQGTTITWTSSDDTIIDAQTGVVQRPTYTSGDKEVTLEATITKGTEISEKQFQMTVKKSANQNSGGSIVPSTPIIVTPVPSVPLPSSNANLQTFALSLGEAVLELTPAFDPAITHYEASTEQNELVIQSALGDVNATATYSFNDQKVNVGDIVKLQPGVNVLQIVIEAQDYSKKTYTFEITLTEVEEPITPSEPPVPAIFLSDMEGNWAQSLIEQAIAQNIITGFADGTFRPNSNVSRAEYITMIMRALYPNIEGTNLANFNDLQQVGSWAQNSINQAANLGIVNGYTDGSIRPNEAISRAEMVVIVARALGLSDTDTTDTNFHDESAIPNWAKRSVQALLKMGLIEGREGNRFDPQGDTTRAEAIALIVRMLD